MAPSVQRHDHCAASTYPLNSIQRRGLHAAPSTSACLSATQWSPTYRPAMSCLNLYCIFVCSDCNMLSVCCSLFSFFDRLFCVGIFSNERKSDIAKTRSVTQRSDFIMAPCAFHTPHGVSLCTRKCDDSDVHN